MFGPWLLKNFPVAPGITSSVTANIKPMVKNPLFIAGGSDGYKVLTPHAAAHGFEEVLEYRAVFEERFHSISFRW